MSISPINHTSGGGDNREKKGLVTGILKLRWWRPVKFVAHQLYIDDTSGARQRTELPVFSSKNRQIHVKIIQNSCRPMLQCSSMSFTKWPVAGANFFGRLQLQKVAQSAMCRPIWQRLNGSDQTRRINQIRL